MRLTASAAIGALVSRARSKKVCPASSFDDRTWLAIGLVEPAETSIGVGLHQSRIARQMLLPATIRRIEEHGRWRVWPGKRAVVAHIGPEPARPGLTLGQDRHCGVVGVDALRRKDMAPDRIDQVSSDLWDAKRRDAEATRRDMRTGRAE
jgi:hypothetical protein